MTNEIKIFNFNQNQVRTILRDGEPWFVAKDIADALEYRDAPNAIRTLDEDELRTHIMSTNKGDRELAIINESGLYSLVLKSRKPEAKIFKRWVTGEVLPAIRKTGAYGMPTPVAVVDMKAIGGMVKKCANVAVKQAISDMFTDNSLDGDLFKLNCFIGNVVKGAIQQELRPRDSEDSFDDLRANAYQAIDVMYGKYCKIKKHQQRAIELLK